MRPLVLSIDIPSGLNADKPNRLARQSRPISRSHSLRRSRRMFFRPACEFGGELIVADIGSPTSLIEATQAVVVFD